jgi:hypothetical protein
VAAGRVHVDVSPQAHTACVSASGGREGSQDGIVRVLRQLLHRSEYAIGSTSGRQLAAKLCAFDVNHPQCGSQGTWCYCIEAAWTTLKPIKGNPDVSCVCANGYCVSAKTPSKVCCRQQAQACCCEHRCSVPCDEETPCMCTICCVQVWARRAARASRAAGSSHTRACCGRRLSSALRTTCAHGCSSVHTDLPRDELHDRAQVRGEGAAEDPVPHDRAAQPHDEALSA